jgi:hypothetical protein
LLKWQVSRPPGTPVPFKTVRLNLAGNWQRAQLLGSIAIGNGNNASDHWDESGSPYLSTFSKILYDAQACLHYFLYNLEIGESKSSRIAAVFHYTKDNESGVFAAAFRWPA